MTRSVNRSNEGLRRCFRISGRELCRLMRCLERMICCGRLVVDGERIIIPRNAEIKVEIKFQQGRKNELEIKLTWENTQCRRNTRNCNECELDSDNDNDD